MSDELLSLHRLIKQDIADDERRRNDPPPDEFNKGSRLGYRIALDYVEHEIRMLIEQRKSQPTVVSKDFYCGVCSHLQRGIPCKPEDGAMVGYCPKCDKRQIFLRDRPPSKDEQS